MPDMTPERLARIEARSALGTPLAAEIARQDIPGGRTMADPTMQHVGVRMSEFEAVARTEVPWMFATDLQPDIDALCKRCDAIESWARGRGWRAAGEPASLLVLATDEEVRRYGK